MGELSPEAAALIRAGRGAFLPGAADHDRVLQSLTGALGDAGVVEGAARQAGAAKSVVAGQLTLRSWIVGGLSVIALGAGVIVGILQLRTTAASHAPVDAPSSSARPEVIISPTAFSSTEAAASDAPRAPSTPNVGRPGSPSAAHALLDSLPEEVRLLSRAEQQLNGGLAEDALKTLAEHERRFPNGALAEERLAARVHALCALGRTTEARADLARLGRAHPHSQQLERARKFCSMSADSAH